MSDPRYSDSRYDDRTIINPPPVVDDRSSGIGGGTLLGAVVALLLLGGLFMFYNRDATVATGPADTNTGSVTRSAPAPTTAPTGVRPGAPATPAEPNRP
jgi:hypothetical protein